MNFAPRLHGGEVPLQVRDLSVETTLLDPGFDLRTGGQRTVVHG
jgi:hypothetical protein